MSSCGHDLDIKCRFPQTRSYPCTLFSGVLIPLVRKCNTSPEIISNLDGRLLFKVQTVSCIFYSWAVASPHRGASVDASVPNGGSVEFCLNLSHISDRGMRERRRCAAFLRFRQLRKYAARMSMKWELVGACFSSAPAIKFRKLWSG